MGRFSGGAKSPKWSSCPKGLRVTDHEAMKYAMSELKAHGFRYQDLSEVLGEGPKTAIEIIEGGAELLRSKGHNACAESLLKLREALVKNNAPHRA